MKATDMPYIHDMRKACGVDTIDSSKDKTIESLDPFERTQLIIDTNYGYPDCIHNIKDWIQSQGIIFVDRERYVNIDIFLRKAENCAPKDPKKKAKFLKMLEILREVFNE